jgi:hypothetical protein
MEINLIPYLIYSFVTPKNIFNIFSIAGIFLLAFNSIWKPKSKQEFSTNPLKQVYPSYSSNKPNEKYFFTILIHSPKIDEYNPISKKYNFNLTKIDSQNGYIIHAETKPLSYLKFFNLSKTKNDNLSISVNCSREPVSINSVKKFILSQKTLTEKFSGKLIIGEELFANLNFSKKFRKQELQINDEKQYFYLFN